MAETNSRILANRYEVGELLGRGGMAEVYLGRDTRLSRTVAIKVLRADLARDPSFQGRFRREAQAAAALNHPAIVSVYDTGEDVSVDAQGAEHHVPYIVMEYVEGHTVRDLLQDGSALPLNEAIDITIGVLAALEYSHHAGIVHRDIKPGNVMITPTGAIKVMDFGIARAMADSGATMTQTSAVVGTAQYLSPEQARGETVDARSDLYSTGCLLFELLTGRPPFTGDSAVAVAYQHVSENPQPPSAYASDVPESLDRIVIKALAKNRDDRYSDAAQFRADLEAATRNDAILAPPVSQTAAMTQVLTSPAAAAASPVGTQLLEEFPDPEADTPQDDENKSRKGLIWALSILGVLLLAGVVFAIIQLTGNDAPEPPTTAQVPDLSGMTANEARAALEGEGFVFDLSDETQPSDTVEADLVLTWDPQGEQEVGTTITVVLSSGPDAVDIPDLEGLTEDAAQAALEDVGLVFALGSPREPSNSIAEDLVVRWSPDGSAARGDTVTVYLSSGPDTIEVPDVSGMTLSAATRLLQDEGFVVDSENEDIAGLELNRVDRTEPAAGTGVEAGGTVKIIAGTGNVILDDLTGMDYEDARQQLVELGLQPSQFPNTDVRDDVAPGTVVAQSAGPGAVPNGSTVTLTVAESSPDEEPSAPEPEE